MPSIAAHWIKNKVVAAIISCVALLAIQGVSRLIGTNDPGSGGVAILCVATFVFLALAGIAHGILTAAVLQRIIPRLSVRMWVALHVALALLMGTVAGEITGGLAFAPPIANDKGLFEAALLFLTACVGVIAGALGGGAEALVLRRVALGTLAWIGWSTVAYAIVIVEFVGGARLWGIGPGFMGQLMWQSVGFLGELSYAVVMLPALRHLKDPLLAKASGYFT